MGFDVLYFPPVHPIGRINRKGRNNALRAAQGDLGSPYAIGSAGGRPMMQRIPNWARWKIFRALLQQARQQWSGKSRLISPSSAPRIIPGVTEHRDWFRWRPDGSMRYAENPPKKYEDIVNPEFYGEASFPAVWIALRDVISVLGRSGCAQSSGSIIRTPNRCRSGIG